MYTRSHNSSMPHGGVENSFKRHLRRAQKCSMVIEEAIGEVGMAAISTILAPSYLCVLDHYPIETQNCWEPNCNA